MVFGNMGDDCATGVVFTRNPGDGTKQIYGEYLVNAQGEDVVAGVRTGKQVNKLKKEMPDSYKQLAKTCEKLEKYFKEPQDIEFTIEKGKFYLLQTRNAKMNAVSMTKTSVDMVKEKLIDKNRALTRLQAEHLEQLLHKTLDQKDRKEIFCQYVFDRSFCIVKLFFLMNFHLGRYPPLHPDFFLRGPTRHQILYHQPQILLFQITE